MDEEYYTVKELATKFKVTKQAIHKWIKEGRIESIKIGRSRRIPARAVDQLIRESQQAEEGTDDDMQKPEAALALISAH